MFTEEFMQRALLVALFLGPLCGLLGVFVTARRMAFFSDTVSHGALAGVALGLWAGFSDPAGPMILVSLGIAALMMWLRENTALLTDSIMALLLSGSVAVGIIILNALGRRADLHRYLFGDILAVRWMDVWIALALSIGVCIAILTRLNPWVLLTTNEDLAHVTGVNVRRLNYLFVLLLTLSVAVTIRLLGIVLVTALLVIPAAAAHSLSKGLRQHLILSSTVGMIGSVVGTMASYRLNSPCGPTIVIACIACFAISLVISSLRSGFSKT